MREGHPCGMDQLGEECQDKIITFVRPQKFRCPKCGERTLLLRKQDFEDVQTEDFPRYGRNGYFEAGCSNCDFGEHRDMFVAVPDMATAVALVYLYDLAGKPL
jgi:predicted nucleic-acid-binding Zn-ribbon protein